VFNGARLLGPSLGGILVASFGEGWCFLINGISYIAVISALLMINLKYDLSNKKESNVLEELKEGLVYIVRYFPIRVLLIMVAVISFFGMPFLVVIPAYVREVLHGNSETLGFLMSFFGAGALTAAIYMAARKSVLGLGKVLFISTFIYAIGIISIAYVPWKYLAYCIAFPAGFGLIASLACVNTLLQTLTDEDKRGRVMSFYSMGLISMTPIGSMLFSLIEKVCGLSLTVVFFGVICVSAALVYEHYRPIVRRLSRPAHVQDAVIVPEIAQGLQIES